MERKDLTEYNKVSKCDKEAAKKAYDLAKKEMEEKEISRIKEVVLETLRKIEEFQLDIRDTKAAKLEATKAYDEKIAEKEKQVKLLKMDIEDLKAGRLERMEERQRLDADARKLAVIIIERVIEKEKVVPIPFFPPRPYEINPQPWINPGPVWVAHPNTITYEHNNIDGQWNSATSNEAYFAVDPGTAREAVIGCYVVSDNKTVNIR